MNVDLRGKTAVVTGAGRRTGLGDAIVRRLAAAGAKVVLSDVGASADAATPADMVGEKDEMQVLAREVAAQSAVQVLPFACDERDPDRTNELAQFAHSETGSLDIWINNAGIGYIMKPLLEVQQMAARIPLGRPGLPAYTANAVAFPCSDAAAYITAESMNVSGGEEPH